MPAFGFDLAKELAFYGAYHTHPANQFIHLCCIPALFWSWCVALCSISSSPLPGGLQNSLPAPFGSVPLLSPGLALWAMYAVYYASLDAVAGTLIGLIYLVIYLAAAWFTAQGAGALGLSVLGFAAAVQVAGWAVQLGPGHAFFERRKPALADSLVQAFLLGPLFVWLEVFFLLGYRPKLQREVQKMVDKQLAAWGVKKQKGAKAGGGGGRAAGGGGAGSSRTTRRGREQEDDAAAAGASPRRSSRIRAARAD